MKIYWSMNSIPELAGLERAEKTKRYRELFKHGRKQVGFMPFVYMLLVGIVCAVLAMMLGLGTIARGAFIGGGIGFASILLFQSPVIEHGRVWYRDTYGSEDA